MILAEFASTDGLRQKPRAAVSVARYSHEVVVYHRGTYNYALNPQNRGISFSGKYLQ